MRKPANNLTLRVFLLGLSLSLIGLLAIYNSSAIEGFRDFQDKFHFLKLQSIWLLMGIITFYIAKKIKITFIKKFTLFLLAISVLLMILVLVPGISHRLQGARRWLNLGLFSFQPSEVFKLSLIIYLASWLEAPKPLKSFLLITLLSLALVMLQPDLGSASVIVVSAFSLYYLSGAKIKDLILFFSLLSGLVALLIFTSPYRLRRFQTFLDPSNDPLGSSYHINQILLGLGSGGFSGVGLGKSRQKYAYLPESTTDSIFIVIGEELGFIGSALLVSIFVIFLLTAFKIANYAPSHYQRLLASGLTLLLLTQVFVNLGSMVALLPLTGMPLPFISYGGSSLLSSYVILGLLANIAENS